MDDGGRDAFADIAQLLRPQLGERYTVGEVVGEGATAVVFRAFDETLERDVAVKVLRPELATTIASERFHREIRVAAGLSHDRVLPVYDSGGTGNCVYYTMPLASGRTLEARLDAEGPLPIDEALAITSDVAEALAFAHGQGVVHRDVKPGNILLSEHGAVVADFGLARAVSEAGLDKVTKSGMAVGTPAYMSPEQGDAGAKLDARSDQYSLACVLYEMISGEPPFTGPTAMAVMARHRREPPPSLEVVRPGLPDAIELTVERALSKVAADRFPTITDFVSSLTDPDLRRPKERVGWRTPLTVAAALFVVAGAAYLALRPTTLLDSRLVGFPLVDRGEAPAGQSGIDLALVIGAGLDHAPIKWYDGWKWLAQDLRDRGGAVEPPVASEIARDLAARYYMTGTAQHGVDSTRVVVELMDVEGDSLVQRETEAGASSEVTATQLALRALVQLVPFLVGSDAPQIDLSHLLDRDPSAMAVWMTGEQLYRASRFSDALESYQRALDLDSLMVLAALKGAQAASWTYQTDAAERLVETALARADLLPAHQRQYAHGLRAYLHGEAGAAAGALRQALDLDDEWPEAWMTLGEAHYHLIPSEWASPTLADSAFARVLRLDPGFTPAAIHRVESLVREGDRRAAQRLVDRLSDSGAEESILARVGALLSCSLAPGAPLVVDSENTIRPTMEAARALTAAGAHPGCGEAGFRAILSRPGRTATATSTWNALEGLYGASLSQAGGAERLAIADSLFAEGLTSVGQLYLMADAFGYAFERQAQEFEDFVMGVYRGRYGDRAYESGTVTTLWSLAIWYHSRGNHSEVQRISEAVTSRVVASSPPDMVVAAEAISGWAAFSAGDTATAMSVFARLQPVLPSARIAWDVWGSLAAERIMLARLHLELGEYSDAFRVAAVFDHPQPVMYLPHLAVSLAIRAEAARGLGRRADTREALARLGDLGWNAAAVRTLLAN